MPSIAVLPTLTKTLTDLMDEDLYLAPQAMPGLPYDALNPVNFLNTDSFIDQYSRLNGLNSAFTSLHNEPYQLLPMVTGDNNLNLRQMNSNPMESQNPDPSLIRTMSKTARMRSRIQTLDPHLLTLPNKQKDDESFLFNSDILPLNLMNPNYFNPGDALDNSFFVPKNDDMSFFNMNQAPIPGYEGDYLQLDGLEEDAEYLSEDSDDGNYFQDEDDDDYMDDDYKFPEIMNTIPAQSDYMRVYPAPTVHDIKFSNEDLQSADLFNFDKPLGLHQMEPSRDLAFLQQSFDDHMETSEPEDIEEICKQMDLTMPTPQTLKMKKDDDDDYVSSQSEESQPPTKPVSPVTEHHYDLSKPSICTLCSKHFSRPYDLVRHENTIHAAKKKIFRCVICEGRADGGAGNGKLKTFSRGDALTRHIKMKHGLEGVDAADLIAAAKDNVEYVKN